MNKNKLLIRSLGFLAVGLFIAFIFTITLGSFSSYTKGYEGAITQVEAATTQDFIEEMEIYYEGDKAYIKLKKSDNIDYSPIIFFSVHGDLEDYILHIDPVELYGESIIPIISNVNLPQAISLILSPKKEIIGEIRIKHLNNFIDEILPINIPKSYLLERYFFGTGFRNIQRDSFYMNTNNEMMEFVEKLVTHTNSYLDWNSAISVESDNVDISNYQRSIIDTVAPNLLDYTEDLYSLMGIITTDLNKEKERNNNLSKENQLLLEEILKLETNIDNLKNQIDKLEKDNDNEGSKKAEESEKPELETNTEKDEKDINLEIIEVDEEE